MQRWCDQFDAYLEEAGIANESAIDAQGGTWYLHLPDAPVVVASIEGNSDSFARPTLSLAVLFGATRRSGELATRLLALNGELFGSLMLMADDHGHEMVWLQIRFLLEITPLDCVRTLADLLLQQLRSVQDRLASQPLTSTPDREGP